MRSPTPGTTPGRTPGGVLEAGDGEEEQAGEEQVAFVVVEDRARNNEKSNASNPPRR